MHKNEGGEWEWINEFEDKEIIRQLLRESEQRGRHGYATSYIISRVLHVRSCPECMRHNCCEYQNPRTDYVFVNK